MLLLPMKFKNADEARAAAYTIDTTVYPWVAYQGPRFQPTAFTYVPTDKESVFAEVVGALQNMSGAFDTPVERMRRPFDSFQLEAVESMRAALAAVEKLSKGE